jgi:hypothetical protein
MVGRIFVKFGANVPQENTQNSRVLIFDTRLIFGW